MLVNIFKSNQKGISILVLIVSIILWIPSFRVDQNQLINTGSLPFYLSNNVLIFSISALLIGLQAIYLNYIVNEFKLLSSRTHLPALLFVVLNVGISSLLVFTPLLIVNSLLLMVLHQLFLVYNQNNASSLSFNIGILIAVVLLIYPPLLFLFFLLWITLLYTKPPNWRELVIAILGFLLPVAFYVAYYFLIDQLLKVVTYGLGGYRVFTPVAFPVTILGKSFFFVLFLIGVFAGFNFLKVLSSHVVKVKKHLVMIILLLLILLSTLLFNSLDYMATYVLLTIPLAIVLANYLNELKKKWLAELLFAILLLAIAVGYFS